MIETTKTWLQNLKAGDTVLVDSIGIGATAEPATVDRVTATQIVIGSCRYRILNGHQVGSKGWSRRWLVEATPEALAKAAAEQRRRMLIAKLDTVRWKSQSLETLEAVCAVLPEEISR